MPCPPSNGIHRPWPSSTNPGTPPHAPAPTTCPRPPLLTRATQVQPVRSPARGPRTSNVPRARNPGAQEHAPACTVCPCAPRTRDGHAAHVPGHPGMRARTQHRRTQHARRRTCTPVVHGMRDSAEACSTCPCAPGMCAGHPVPLRAACAPTDTRPRRARHVRWR